MDLNYRPPALQAGFAMFFADPAFFSCKCLCSERFPLNLVETSL